MADHVPPPVRQRTRENPRCAAAIGTVLAAILSWWLAAAAAAAAAEENTAPAPDARVSVEMSAAPAQLTMGDNLVVTITYRWPRGWRADEPNPSRDFLGQFVIASPPPRKLGGDGREERSFALTVCPLSSGAWELPRPGFTAAPEHGAAVNAVANQVIVQVGVNKDAPAPPDARPLLKRPPPGMEPARRWMWIAGGCAALVALAAWMAARRRRLREAAAPGPREIFARELAEAGRTSDGKESGARISLALRRFAGSVWNFDGPGSTAREAAVAVRAVAPDSEARELSRLLENLDALRWAADDLVVGALAPLMEASSHWSLEVQRRLDDEELARRQVKRGATRSSASGSSSARAP